MKQQLEAIRKAALDAISDAGKAEDLEALRVRYLGKKGELTAVLKQMGKLSAEERPVIGQLANDVRAKLEANIEEKAKELADKAMELKLKSEAVDVTIPGKQEKIGVKHPMYQVLDEIKDIFVGMGFEILEDREVELAEYNFTKLNVEEGHPAREWSDTFYFTEDSSILLRTQTSPMQIHAMETRELPIRILAPGRVYRKDEVDATHSPMFHQIEGMAIDKGITMADLKGTLNEVVRQLYGEHTVTRFRPHHFPFTEPSCEMDIQCHKCHGAGCPTCKGEGWIEVLGAGMIHPNMGTMLCFLTTDCAISSEMIKSALLETVQVSFNRISVDGDTSTNDTCCVLANGLAGNPVITEKGPDYDAFVEALRALCVELAKKMASDGEGATHLITCTVTGAGSEQSAETVAKSVIGSALTKAAIFGADANWGRVLCAMGYSGEDFNPDKVDVAFQSQAGSVQVCAKGRGLDFDEDLAKRVLTEHDVTIAITMGEGDSSCTCWGCDLTYEYVKINGDYRT